MRATKFVKACYSDHCHSWVKISAWAHFNVFLIIYRGSRLATTSGDTTVKIWDFSKEQCVASFTDHTHAVWGCSWHSNGDFLATCAMDGTSKIWDLNR